MLTQLNKSLESWTDQEVIEEAARRLQQLFTEEHGQMLMFGTFRFVFHEGRFQAVEDCPRNKLYLSPSGVRKK